MKRKTLFRLISSVMLIVAAIFVFCALSNPQLGSAIYIGSFRFGADEWRICYAIYVIIMILLFILSFIPDKKNK